MDFLKIVIVLLKFDCLYADSTIVKYKKYFGTTDSGGSATVDCVNTINGTSIGLDFSIANASCTGLTSSWLEDKLTAVDHIYMQKVRSDDRFDPPIYLYHNSATDENKSYLRTSPIELVYGSTIVVYCSATSYTRKNTITLKNGSDYPIRIITSYKQGSVKCEARYGGANSNYTENISYDFDVSKVQKVTFKLVLGGYEVYLDDEWLVDFKDASIPHLSTDVTAVVVFVHEGNVVYLHRIDFIQ